MRGQQVIGGEVQAHGGHRQTAGNPARVIGDVRKRKDGGSHANALRNAAPAEVLKAVGAK